MFSLHLRNFSWSVTGQDLYISWYTVYTVCFFDNNNFSGGKWCLPKIWGLWFWFPIRELRRSNREDTATIQWIFESTKSARLAGGMEENHPSCSLKQPQSTVFCVCVDAHYMMQMIVSAYDPLLIRQKCVSHLYFTRAFAFLFCLNHHSPSCLQLWLGNIHRSSWANRQEFHPKKWEFTSRGTALCLPNVINFSVAGHRLPIV